MTDRENRLINKLFLRLQDLNRSVDHHSAKELGLDPSDLDRDIRGRIVQEDLEETGNVIKRLVRAFFRFGAHGELLGHVEVGTFPPFAIHAAVGKLTTGIAPRGTFTKN